MVEQYLLNIIDAADLNDSDDVETRRLLAAALRDSGLDLAQLMSGRIPPVRRSCQAGAVWRVSRVRSSSHGRLSPLLAGQSRRR